MLNSIEYLRSGGNVFRSNTLLSLGVFLLVNFAFVLPLAAQSLDDEALAEAARHVKRKDYEEALKIIRDRPQASWAIIDQIAVALGSHSIEASRPKQLNDATKLILSKASSDRLLNYWDANHQIDTLLLSEIANRLAAAQPDADAKTPPALAIDAKRGLAAITDAITTKRSRMSALWSLGRLPTLELNQKTFNAVVACLDDETSFTSSRGDSSWSIRGGAVDVLSQHIHRYEKELASLLDDESGHRRWCGIEILSSDAQVFDRHGDRIFEMLKDPNKRVRIYAASRLPLLLKRLPEVVTYFTNQKHDAHGVCACIDSLFEKCNREDQKRLLHWLTEGSVQNRSCANSLRIKLPSAQQADLNDLLDLMLANYDLKSATQSQLRVLSAAGSRAKLVLPAMRKALLDADQEMEHQLHLATAVYEITGDAKEVLPYFQTALETDIGPLHKVALLGIRAIGPDAVELAPLIVSQLDNSPTGQHWSLMALRAIGPGAKGVLPKLEALHAAWNHEKSDSYLVKAIKSIRGPQEEKGHAE